MTPMCGVAELLRPGGPVRVPLRECCAAALVGAGGETSACAAARVGPGRAAFPAVGSTRLASPAGVDTVAGPAVRRATGPDGDRGQPAEVAR
ncbi:hypothetical protein KZ829_28590 [Actinoplanes hulinensis]|uniref:Uncharacterized protein n=1 Tax=Actinoplanes hulinensis TaxID=1144547 RepID=A0ABS7B9M8_9ACTN|nr:hypothetical protein [Actinoplanes hulinensis]MBW6437700.1 hypothetical protein [Actinoplanes hulinensis]